MPTKDKRLSVPLSDSSFDDLEYITNTLNVTKASVIKEILDDALPEVRKLAEYTESLGDNPDMGHISTKLGAQILSKVSEVMNGLSDLQTEGKNTAS